MCKSFIKPCVALGLFVACASSGTRPHAMSAPAHDVQAAAHERAAAQADAQVGRPEIRSWCSERRLGAQVCWTSVRDASEEYRRLAEEHRRTAAKHRAASSALRDAESRFCVGIDADDRDISPFAHVEDIASVEPLWEPNTVVKTSTARLAGAIVVFRAVPGLTRDRLQAVIDCHVARNAVVGHDEPSMAGCPLQPAGVRATVEGSEGGLVVYLRADDAPTADEVLSRAQRVVQRTGHRR
ncbi:MAG: hypothetical protein JNL82_08295 [Myxococcales bacterium]|nr:hypothetical protein [Myxococcales bacterium]